MTEEIVKEYDSVKWANEKRAKAADDYKAKVDAEAKELVARWGNTGLLTWSDEYISGQMALLLENQRLMNEVATDSGDMAHFKRISIPLVRRVFDPTYCLIWELASMQVMMGPTAWVYFDGPTGRVAEEVAAKTKRLKCLWAIPLHDNIREQWDLNKEAELTAILSAEVCNEINEELISDLRNNAGIHEYANWDGPEALWSSLTGLFDKFENDATNRDAFGRRPNWIVAGKSLAIELKKAVEFEPCLETIKPIERVLRNGERISPDWWDKLKCIRTGTLNKEIKLIECEELLPNDILVGYKNGHYGSGYCWCPYVPFTRTPIMLDPESFTPRCGILTRYTKRLSINGSHFYARMSVKGHEGIGEKAEKSE